MSCGCGKRSTPTVETVETAQQAADRRRATQDQQRSSQENAQANAGA